MLTPHNKQQRLQACANFLEWYEAMSNFLDSIVIGDETWVHHFKVAVCGVITQGFIDKEKI
jgi:hypothetical protein